MAYRATYASGLRVCETYDLDPESYPLPHKRTHGHYRRKCAKCSKFLAKDRKSAYCSACNALRRRDDRVRQGQNRMTTGEKQASRLDLKPMEDLNYLITSYLSN